MTPDPYSVVILRWLAAQLRRIASRLERNLPEEVVDVERK